MQPFLREKTSESNPKNGENIVDSANQTKNEESRNDDVKKRRIYAKNAESKKRFFASHKAIRSE
ncbi:hypothetical protein [Helicobacter sp. 23-1045]